MVGRLWAFLTAAGGVLVTALMGVGWLYGGYHDVLRQLALADSGVTIDAEATGWSSANHFLLGERFSVDYRFIVADRVQGSNRLGEPVDHETWLRSRESRTLTVRYAADDPTLHLPLAATDHGMGHALVMLALGGFFCLVALATPIALVVLVLRRS